MPARFAAVFGYGTGLSFFDLASTPFLPPSFAERDRMRIAVIFWLFKRSTVHVFTDGLLDYAESALSAKSSLRTDP